MTLTIIVTNVVIRIWWKPLPGTFELTEILGALIFSLGIAYCSLLKEHVSVEFLIKRFSKRSQAIVDSLTNLIAIPFFGALTWSMLLDATKMLKKGDTTAHLSIPVYPFVYLVAFGLFMVVVVLLLNVIKSVLTVIKGSENQ